jgi:cell division protein FtsB
MGTAKPNIFSDPLKVAEKHPALRTHLFEWLEDQPKTARTWTKERLDAFLASFAYEIMPGNHGWGVHCAGIPKRWTAYDSHPKTEIEVYHAALTMLEAEIQYLETQAAETAENIRQAQREGWAVETVKDVETMLNL